MVVYLEQKRRDYADLSEKIQHVAAGFPLLMAGVRKLQEGNEIPIESVELTADRASSLHTRGRRDAIRLRGLLNAPEVRQAIEAHVPERLKTV